VDEYLAALVKGRNTKSSSDADEDEDDDIEDGLDSRTREECHAKWYWAARETHCVLMKRMIAHNVPWPRKLMSWTLLFSPHKDERAALLLWLAGMYNKGSINAPRRYETYLHHAVTSGLLQISKLLLDAEADPNHEVDAELHYLSEAVAADDIEMAQLLIVHGAKVSGFDWMDPPITHVQSQEMLSLLLKAGAEDCYDENQETLLMKAARGNDVDRVKLLLQYTPLLA
jgi:hypothetical protein